LAQKHNQSLEISDIQEALLQLAARHASEPDALRTEVLRLASALINAAAIPSLAKASKRNESNSPPPEALTQWRESCARFLAAIAPAMEGLNGVLRGETPNAKDDSLAARVTQLSAQTRESTETMAKSCQILREQTSALLREASRFGALERELQLKKARFADQVARATAAENAIKTLDAEADLTASKIEELQIRLRLASRTPEEISRLEEEVNQAEASDRDLAKQLGDLEEKHSILLAQTRTLPERIEKTERLISDLRQSPAHALIEQINEIWERVRRLHEASA
jgi:chromosome segregation ATPase